MFYSTKSLLQEAGRFREVLVGWVCAFISAVFAGILVWLAYVVAWRNPREYGVNDLYKGSTLVIFLILFAVAAGFSLVAFRLISRERKRTDLMSPLFLRIWGGFFGVMSIVVLIGA